ncbi:uncharacterized protein LOC114324056 [Camellia sinensis]|uniref:uncharacterized protein LOC114324056 n=1 Tax=Camellia sinensis TaxID=4442 RepID=UPI0010364D9D|nr:uncharacterized protein LOC114324056 [Camellia sinensis]
MAGRTRANGSNDNNNSDVMNFVRAITNELRNQPKRENNKGELIVKFQKIRPQAFSGEPNPYVAEAWIRQVKKILETLEIQNEQDQMSLASFLFDGEADFWWTMIKESRQVADLSWRQFEELFMEKYFPNSVRQEMIQEFLQLKQRGMTVTQYANRFEALSRHAKL